MSTDQKTTTEGGLPGRAERVVIKIGSSLLADDEGLRRPQIRRFAHEIAGLRRAGTAVTLVSSGAIAAGRTRIATPARPTIPERQAAAAVGQIHLMTAYETAFARHKIPVAQILLDADDHANRHRFLNATHALDMLHSHGVLPIVNENDTVSVDELKFGDNDHLSAMVASLVSADVLVILSDVDGVYTADPGADAAATRIPLIRRVDAPLLARTRGGRSRFGTGGMESKLLAARKAASAGIPTIIADGRTKGAIARALDPDQDEGTLVLPVADRLGRRKHWIAFSIKTRGILHIDEGAVRAVRDRGRSLLPSGITAVEGRFEAGDCVSIVDPAGTEIARGLCSYGAREAGEILGHRSSEVQGILGYRMGSAVVHRNDLVVLDGAE
jgi:glutamate 5-kinase